MKLACPASFAAVPGPTPWTHREHVKFGTHTPTVGIQSSQRVTHDWGMLEIVRLPGTE